jgi:hypothetical protein
VDAWVFCVETGVVVAVAGSTWFVPNGPIGPGLFDVLVVLAAAAVGRLRSITEEPGPSAVLRPHVPVATPELGPGPVPDTV